MHTKKLFSSSKEFSDVEDAYEETLKEMKPLYEVEDKVAIEFDELLKRLQMSLATAKANGSESAIAVFTQLIKDTEEGKKKYAQG